MFRANFFFCAASNHAIFFSRMTVLTPFFRSTLTYLLLESRGKHEDVMIKFADKHTRSSNRWLLVIHFGENSSGIKCGKTGIVLRH